MRPTICRTLVIEVVHDVLEQYWLWDNTHVSDVQYSCLHANQKQRNTDIKNVLPFSSRSLAGLMMNEPSGKHALAASIYSIVAQISLSLHLGNDLRITPCALSVDPEFVPVPAAVLET
jgi:hypothetical protein